MKPMSQAPTKSETITLAGGCFWCTEAVYERVRGVLSVQSGYSNGHLAHPNYEQVCSGQTGHAEVVRVRFDPSVVSLRELLEVFFAVHDPTSLNRQGADVGTQYRSGIYWNTEAQASVAREVIAEAQGAHEEPLVTELLPERNYFPAEDYHQQYYARNPEQGYCAFVVAGKVDKFLASFRRLVK